MTPDKSAKAANLVVADKSASVPEREPSVGDNDRARRARSEAVSSASPNRRLFEYDARWRITKNRVAQEYNWDWDDLHNVIEDRRHLRLRTPSPPQCFMAEDLAPTEKSGFCALAGPLRQIRWPDKFKTGNIDKYDNSSNLEEFI
jgi:hypothetical protein